MFIELDVGKIGIEKSFARTISGTNRAKINIKMHKEIRTGISLFILKLSLIKIINITVIAMKFALDPVYSATKLTKLKIHKKIIFQTFIFCRMYILYRNGTVITQKNAM